MQAEGICPSLQSGVSQAAIADRLSDAWNTENEPITIHFDILIVCPAEKFNEAGSARGGRFGSAAFFTCNYEFHGAKVRHGYLYQN